MSLLAWWIDTLNPLGINSALFTVAWMLGMTTAILIVAYLVLHIVSGLKDGISPVIGASLVGGIILGYLIFAPYAGFCVMPIVGLLVLRGILWVVTGRPVPRVVIAQVRIVTR